MDKLFENIMIDRRRKKQLLLFGCQKTSVQPIQSICWPWQPSPVNASLGLCYIPGSFFPNLQPHLPLCPTTVDTIRGDHGILAYGRTDLTRAKTSPLTDRYLGYKSGIPFGISCLADYYLLSILYTI